MKTSFIVDNNLTLMCRIFIYLFTFFSFSHAYVFKSFHRISYLSRNLLSSRHAEPKVLSQQYNNRTFVSMTQGLNSAQKKPLSSSITDSYMDLDQSLQSSSAKNLITSLKRLIDKKIKLSNVERKRLQQSLISWIPKLSPAETSMLTWCAGTLMLSSRSEDMIAISDLLFDRLSMARHQLSAEDMAISLVGFARFGVKFPHVSSTSFLDCIPSLIKLMDNQQVANTVWSLGRIGIDWSNLPLKSQKSICEALSANVRSMTSQGVANSIYGNFCMIIS